MVKLTEHGVVLAADGTFAASEDALQKAEGKAKTMPEASRAVENAVSAEPLQVAFIARCAHAAWDRRIACRDPRRTAA